MSCRAFSAISASRAATAATVWPIYKTFSRAMMFRVMSLKFTTISPFGTNSDGKSSKSSRVTTALTPFKASAFDVSIDMIFACACGLRRTRPTSMLGRDLSAPNSARPVTLSTPSGRSGRVPTIFSSRSR